MQNKLLQTVPGDWQAQECRQIPTMLKLWKMWSNSLSECRVPWPVVHPGYFRAFPLVNGVIMCICRRLYDLRSLPPYPQCYTNVAISARKLICLSFLVWLYHLATEIAYVKDWKHNYASITFSSLAFITSTLFNSNGFSMCPAMYDEMGNEEGHWIYQEVGGQKRRGKGWATNQKQ